MIALIRIITTIWTVPALLVVALASSFASSRAAESPSQNTARAALPKWTVLSVELPKDESTFPPGDGAELTGQCLICHSAGMVLRQPPLTREEWIGEINKMRNAFGAPLPAEQVGLLADYLYRINGRDSHAAHSAVEAQGS